MTEFSDLLGKTITKFHVKDERITISTTDGDEYLMYHLQDCCENVTIDAIEGDVSDLLGSPITLAEESSSTDKYFGKPEYDGESWTWTFYRLATVKGYVNIRWLGESNGYYSEGVDFVKK